MTSSTNKYQSFVIRYRWLIIIFWLVGLFLSHFLPAISSVAQTNNSDFLPAQAPSIKASNVSSLITGIRADSAQAIVVASVNHGTLSDAQLSIINQAEQACKHSKDIKKVFAVGESKDQQAFEILAVASAGSLGPSSTGQVVIDDLRATLRKFNIKGLTFHVTGPLAAFIDSQKATTNSENTAGLFSIIFILGLLLIVFRSPLAPILTLLPDLVSLLISQRLIAESTHIGVSVSEITQILLVVIVLGAGTDYGLFLIYRLREELKKDSDFFNALTLATRRIRKTIFFSALTVITALLCLLLSAFGLYRGLGPGLAIGIATVLIANLTLLPALLAVFKKATFWPLVPKLGQATQGFWGKIAVKVIKKPVLTLVVAMIVFATLGSFLFEFKAAGFGSPTVSTKTADSYLGQQVLEKHFSNLNFNPTFVVFAFPKSIYQDPQILPELYKELIKTNSFSAIEGPLNPNGYSLTLDQLLQIHSLLSDPVRNSFEDLKILGLTKALSQYISPTGNYVQFNVGIKAGSPGSTAALNAVPKLRNQITQIAEKLGATYGGLAGEDPAIYDVAHYSALDLEHIIPVVLAFLFLVLILLLGALIAPLYLVITVGISYIASLGFVVVVFQILGHQGGVNFVLPFLMFIFIMALGQDYNILVISRIREEASHKNLGDAIKDALSATGATVTSAGLILAGTFGVLTLTGQSQVQEIGLGLAFGVLLDTFVVRTLLVPSIAILLNEINWWPHFYNLFKRPTHSL